MVTSRIVNKSLKKSTLNEVLDEPTPTLRFYDLLTMVGWPRGDL